MAVLATVAGLPEEVLKGHVEVEEVGIVLPFRFFGYSHWRVAKLTFQLIVVHCSS